LEGLELPLKPLAPKEALKMHLFITSFRTTIRFLILVLAIVLLPGSPSAGSENGNLTVSVQDERFGARGDGVADDTAAIQKTVNWVYSKGGGAILFPPGTYIVTSVDIREGITYEGFGATIKRPPYLT
jgi:hypothetical protein